MLSAESKPSCFKTLSNQYCPNLCDYGYKLKSCAGLSEKATNREGGNPSSHLPIFVPNYTLATLKIKLSKLLYPIQLSDFASPTQQQLPQRLDIFYLEVSCPSEQDFVGMPKSSKVFIKKSSCGRWCLCGKFTKSSRASRASRSLRASDAD